ncbi:Threonine efflux protein [Paraburkholderia humisilvae]|uniref:Threonine efflux protein n=3 Tax=Paraburkholderia humisilvae TaxID=627669 RepID=A0A6J5EL84_9BURK|nr:Threonine efflux protein [Paraburkholderia humisilvae]
MIYAVTCMSPGPDFVNVTSLALNARKNGVFAAAGVAVGCTLWSTAAVFGLDFLTNNLAPFIHLIKLVGMSYLVYLGSRSVLGAFSRRQIVTTSMPADNAWASLRRGFVGDVTNPTLMIFFGSLFASTLPKGAPWWVRCASVFIITSIAGTWHLIVAVVFSIRSAISIYERIRRPIDVALGGILILLALRLAFHN